MPRPSIDGARPQTSGATARTFGIFLRSSAREAGTLLKTGLSALSLSTTRPSMPPSVSPTRFRRLLDRAKSPSTPSTGIDSPTNARIVRIGRVSRFRQAKTPIKEGSCNDCRSGRPPPSATVRRVEGTSGRRSL